MTDAVKLFLENVKNTVGVAKTPTLKDIKALLMAREMHRELADYMKAKLTETFFGRIKNTQVRNESERKKFVHDQLLDGLIEELNSRETLQEVQVILLVMKQVSSVVENMDDAIKLARGMKTAEFRAAVITVYDQYLNMEWVKNLTTVNLDHEYVEILNKEVVKKNPAYAKSVLKCIASQMLTDQASEADLRAVVKITQSLEGDMVNLAVEELSPAYQACLLRMTRSLNTSVNIFHADTILGYGECTSLVASAIKALEALSGESFSLIDQYSIYSQMTRHPSLRNVAVDEYIEINHLLNTVNLCKLVNADYNLFQLFIKSLPDQTQEQICKRIMKRWHAIYNALHAGQAGGVFGKTNHADETMQAEERLRLSGWGAIGGVPPEVGASIMNFNGAAIAAAKNRVWRFRLNNLYQTKILPTKSSRSKVAWEYLELEGDVLISMVYLCAFNNSRTTATSSAIPTTRRLFGFGPQRKPEAETKVDLNADDPRLNQVKAVLRDIAYPDKGSASTEKPKP